jgi:hypothetical protein
VRALSNELLDGRGWRESDGRTFTAAKPQPLAETALLPELQRLADAVKSMRAAVPAWAPS